MEPDHLTRRQVLTGAAAAPILVAGTGLGSLSGADAAAGAATTTVTPSNTVAGGGLPLFGFGMGHYLAGSNTSAWIRYARINAVRAFVNPSHWIKDADVDSGAGVTGLASFDAARADLRRDPEGTAYLDWPTITHRYRHTVPSGTNKYTLDHMFTETRRLGLTVVAQSSLSGDWDPRRPDGTLAWDELWRKWQRGYAHAYHLAKNFGIQRFAIYNEPDVPGTATSLPTMGAFLRALRFGSDAFRCGVEDAGRNLGLPMRALIHAPVITRSTMHDNGTASTGPMTPTNIEKNPATTGYWGGDTRDDTIGWGRAALESIHTDYGGRTVDDKIFDVYDTHSYNEEPAWYKTELPTIKDKVRQHAGSDLPIVYSEINRYNTYWYHHVVKHTMEHAPTAREIGHTAGAATHYYVGSHGGGLLFFKFSNTAGYRTGFYYVDENSEPYEIRGATKGAETLRLFSRALVGDVSRRSTPVASRPPEFSAYSSYDAAAHRHQVLITHGGSGSVSFDLDLSALSPGAAVGQVVTVEEVSSRRSGGIARWVEVPADRRIACVQPADSTWLITVPDTSVTESAPLTATQNTVVRNGADADRALGGAELAVQRQTNAPDEVTFLRFDLPDMGAGGLARAVLQVYGKVEPGADICTVMVFALPDWQWSEDTLTWNSAPYLPPGDCVLNGGRDDLWPAGQMSVTERFTYHRIDVTDVVKALGGRPVTFILIKQPRWVSKDADGNDTSDNSQNDRRVTLLNRSYTHTWARPRLRVWASS